MRAIHVLGIGAVLVALFALMPAPLAEANPSDLVVDGTIVEMSGSHAYNTVSVINGGQLMVAPYDGSAGSGTLTLNASYIEVDATSSINADGRGFRGLENDSGEGPGGGVGGTLVTDGGGGGGYGGAGGDGSRDGGGSPDGAGGASYGSATSLAIEKGSAGGSAGAMNGDYGGFGGDGGGAIWLSAATIIIAGSVGADGDDGALYNNDASGGGAGGGILLEGADITVTGALSSGGGDGGDTVCETPGSCILDDGGGGGGGGRIKIFSTATLSLSGVVSVQGGTGSLYGQDGQDGTFTAPTPECPDFPPGETHTVEFQLCLDDVRLDSDGNGTLDFSSGPVCFTGLGEIWRSDAYLSGGYCTIDKEMKSLYLTGTVGPWPVWLAAGTDQGLGDPSTGKIVSLSQVPGEEFPADNDWKVYFKIGGLPTGELQNCDLDPATLVAQISAIPPYHTAHHGSVIPCCDQGGIVRAEGEDAEGELSLGVGGVVETLDGSAGPDSSLDSSSGSGFNYTVLGVAVAAVAVVVAAGAWFARRRWAR